NGVSSERRAVALGVLIEHLLAMAATEVHRASGELRTELRGRAVDHHAADRVPGLDADESRGCRLRLRTQRLLATAVLNDLGEEAHRDLFGGDPTHVGPGPRPEAARSLQPA